MKRSVLNFDNYFLIREQAVSSVAKMIKALTGKEIKSEGGKILSADLQKSIKKLLDNKDKIKGILG